MRRSLLFAMVVFCLLPCAVSAQTVDWSTSFLFRTTGGFGFENPVIRVGFAPKDYPPDPIMPTEVDLSEPTMLKLTIPDIAVTEGSARILFAVEEDFSINAEGAPDGDQFDFETVGQGVQNFMINLSTGSGGIPIPGSWVAFNPQPEPPANFFGMGFDFEFSSNSPATLVLQAFDDGVAAFSFEEVQAADFDYDGDVDDHDLNTWEENFGIGNLGDANLNGLTDGDDFLIWQRQYSGPAGISAVPEPASAALLIWALVSISFRSSKKRLHTDKSC